MEEPKNLSEAKELLLEKEEEFKNLQGNIGTETVILFKDDSKMYLRSSVVDKAGEFYFIFSNLHPPLLYHESLVDSLVSLGEINENDMEWAKKEVEKRTDNDNKDNSSE